MTLSGGKLTLDEKIVDSFMIIYSKKIFGFISEIKQLIREILANETGLKVNRERFFNDQQNATYPIHVVIYNNKSILGYFDPNFLELGFHECLLQVSKEKLKNIIRHELAHYLTFIKYGASVQSHGREFRSTCEQIGWGEEIHRATFDLQEEPIVSHHEKSNILRKIQKLMSLAASSNTYEAEQAMIKSQQLLLKHNLEASSIDPEDDEKILVKRIMKQRKENAKMRAIARILGTFFVSTVYSRGGGFTYLEILGSALNVEIAEYVAEVLQYEFEKLWIKAQKMAGLKGMTAKNSFYLGIAKGYCNKIDALKKDYLFEINNALMVIEKKLVNAKALVYPNLSSSKSYAGFCQESSKMGEKMGRELNINPALNNPSKPSHALLAFSNAFA